MTRYLLAGGGTAGHVNPLLALADAIKTQSGDNQLWALGTVEGLESRLVPERGFELLTIDRLPMPRKFNGYAFAFPFKFAKAVRLVQQYIKQNQIDVVVGFGGYASAPAYRAAKTLKIPYVVHEANALAGYANRVGARNAAAVAITFANTKLPKATLTGLPLRKEIVELTKTDHRVQANQFFGLDSKLTTLLVTGGSLGARTINETIEKSRTLLEAAGIQVIHIVGDRAGLENLSVGGYRRISYCSRMELAIAAADYAVARSGAATVSEFTAVGLAAIFVPYPVGNGEQRLNAEQVVSAGGAMLVADQDFTPEYVASTLIPLLSNKKAVTAMQEKSKSVGIVNGSEDLLKLVNGVLY
ncbi:MAG: UDP-N-acetylglucosamine--N-acetylmuramyl-(pentapeptide) pyrophosphoryl-undecaprenol N-acetylglucosamine transferase [Rhodoluna sp.]|nr:UDP-N-acetylglucosamine--N-acetylmuramyl-(pentapeptide) pyrophosphoryl-undecaprenol N-acetylglucosamine transferase [Rhodoluna sp.]